MEKFSNFIYKNYNQNMSLLLNRRKRVGETVCFIILSANEILLEPVFKVLAADGSCGHSRGETSLLYFLNGKTVEDNKKLMSVAASE